MTFKVGDVVKVVGLPRAEGFVGTVERCGKDSLGRNFCWIGTPGLPVREDFCVHYSGLERAQHLLKEKENEEYFDTQGVCE